MNFANVRDGIATRLATIANLHVSDTVPVSLPHTPAAGIGLTSVEYDQDMSGGIMAEYAVIIYCSRGGRDAWAQDQVDGFVASIPNAIDGDDDLGTTVDWSRVVRAEVLGTADVGGTSYVAIEFTVQVMGT